MEEKKNKNKKTANKQNDNMKNKKTANKQNDNMKNKNGAKKTSDKKVEKKSNTKKVTEKKVSKKERVEAEVIQNVSKNDTNEMKKLIKIVVIITVIMVIMYLITMLATNKADEVKETTEKETAEAATEIQYDKIMLGTMLNRGGTYYVLIEGEDDNRLTEYDTLIQTIAASEDAPTIYKANLTDAFNKGYLAKEENYYVENIEDFRVKGTTLVKVVDGKIDTALDNHDEIKNKLNELA